MQATFHHIFRLDTFHTFKLNHTSPTDTYQFRQHRSDSSNTAEQIRCFIPLASANPSLHTRFPFTDVAYIRASVHTNQRIPQCIFHCAYALSLQRSRVHTRFLHIDLQSLQSSILHQIRYLVQIYPFASDRCSPRCSPHHRSKPSIIRSSKYKCISDLDPLLHHWCIIHSDLSSSVTLSIQIYFKEKYSFKLRHLAPTLVICTMNFFSLYRFIFFNTMGQNNTMSLQYHEPNQYHEPSIPRVKPIP